MTNDYESLVKTTESQDLGACIQNLINDNLKSLQTCFLGKVIKINGNKLCFERLIKKKENEALVIVNNCLIGFPYSQNWQVQYKLAVGDIGICFTMDCDISHYKTSGNGGVAPTQRQKDLNDSIFIPLSLFKTLSNDSINFIIKSHTKKCLLEFNNSEIGTLKAKLLTIQSENTTLKAALKDLATRLENMAKGNTAPDGHGHASTTAPASIGKFNEWATNLNLLFKD